MSNFFNVIKGLVFGENQVIENYNEAETHGICTRCHKTAKIKKYGLCEECFNARKELLNAANPEIYNQDTYIGINQNLDRLLQYDFNKLDIENAEIVEMSRLIKEAIANLPQKERTVVEYRFYRNMQAKDIATMIGLSPSRITRIIQGALVQIREYLRSKGRNDY